MSESAVSSHHDQARGGGFPDWNRLPEKAAIQLNGPSPN
jgi:hypothetical protein